MRELCSLRRPAALMAVAALSLAACGGDDAAEPTDSTSAPSTAATTTPVEMSVTDAWSRQPAAGQTNTAVYGIVSNPSGSDITIVSASSPVTDRVELHDTIMNDEGQMQMVEREEGFVVPAGGEFVFEPGGPHMMLFDIDPATYPDAVEITLTFDGAEPLTFAAEVRAIDDDMSDMSDMSDDMGDMGDDHGALDATGLHELDEQLATGTLDADAQRSVVADYIAAIEATGPTDGSPEAELLTTLRKLDAALAAGDLDTAATLAADAHEAAHGLEDDDG